MKETIQQIRNSLRRLHYIHYKPGRGLPCRKHSQILLFVFICPDQKKKKIRFLAYRKYYLPTEHCVLIFHALNPTSDVMKSSIQSIQSFHGITDTVPKLPLRRRKDLTVLKEQILFRKTFFAM